ncbi:MAG TPA: hypothetical protein VLF89_09945, partial [Candidatus Saccharimonadales bacterium]|nr:hypothetical protein [Candidatus Saccharimonadales bacterium]
MKKVIRRLLLLAFVVFGILFLGYISLGSPKFPDPPPHSVQSMEDADIEDPLRRAYFTNYTREQIIAHYKDQFRYRPFTMELNYPPEDAGTLVRDQTRSYYLEELVHPFRESLYINGFIPSKAQDDIWYKGVHYEEKITIKYVPSSLGLRIFMAILTLGAIYWMIKEYAG